MLLWVFGHNGIQGNGDADALAKKGFTNPFLGSKLAIPMSPCVAGSRLRSI
jgi:ribonuclease HI